MDNIKYRPVSGKWNFFVMTKRLVHRGAHFHDTQGPEKNVSPTIWCTDTEHRFTHSRNKHFWLVRICPFLFILYVRPWRNLQTRWTWKHSSNIQMGFLLWLLIRKCVKFSHLHQPLKELSKAIIVIRRSKDQPMLGTLCKQDDGPRQEWQTRSLFEPTLPSKQLCEHDVGFGLIHTSTRIKQLKLV